MNQNQVYLQGTHTRNLLWCAEKDQLEEFSFKKGIYYRNYLVYKITKIRKCLKEIYIYTKNVLEIHAVYIKRSIKQRSTNMFIL